MPTTLGPRALNRATLARQHLLSRAALPVEAAVAHLVGMQAQAPWPPYYGLWSRLADFRPGDLADRIVDRSVVRIALMRSTVHLVTAADALTLRPLTQPVHDRMLRASFGRPLAGLDLAAVAAAGRTLVEEQPLTLGELGAVLAERWPDRDGAALAQAVRVGVPLVQVPPRAVWGQGGQARATTLEHWLGRPLDPAPSLPDMVLRYLAGYGPATVMDVQAWSGMTRLKPVVESLRPGLAVFRDAAGRELFDLPDAPRPPESAPAPVRFLGGYDNLLLSHVDRGRVMSDEVKARLFGVRNGQVAPTYLLDGFVQGTWKITRSGADAVLEITPYRPLSAADRDALTAEGLALLAFAEPDAAPSVACQAP